MPNAQASPNAKTRRWGRIAATLGAVVVLLITSVGAGASAMLSHFTGNVSAIDLPGSGEVGDGQPMNILLMGSDTRVGQGSGFGKVEDFGPPRSDTAILLHVAADRKRALAVSLPRDSWVALPDCKSVDGSTDHPAAQGKFNSAFERGGAVCTVKTVESLTGVHVDHFMVVDFKGFEKVIDAIGGVEVCMPKAVDDPKSHLQLPAGHSVVTGAQALAFVRARKTLGDGSDIGRIGRQQQFLSSAIRKATSLGVLANPVTLFQMLDAASSALTVDAGLAGTDQMKNLVTSMQGLSPKNIKFTTVPFKDRGDGENVVWTRAADPIWESMRNDTSYPPPPTNGADGKPLVTTQGDIRVAVYNASGTKGQGVKMANELGALGFKMDGAHSFNAVKQKTTIEYDPRFDESARTLGAALPDATLVKTPGLGHTLNVYVASDLPTPTAIYVSPPKNSNPLDNPSVATVHSADQSICSA
jgi:LCP family protein required for cell wall assembly